MKNKSIDVLHDRVCALCVHLREDTGFLMHLNDLLYGVIELARTGKTVQALGVAREVASYLAEGHSRSVHNARQSAWAASMKAQPGSSVGIGTVAPAWNLNVERMRIHSDGYVQVHHDAPRPAATVEQMRAAADAAMASDDDLTEWTCDVCRKKTLTESMITPIGWSRTLNSNTGKLEYACNECQKFGIKDDAHVQEGAFTCSGCSLRSWTADGKGPLGWVYNVEVDGEIYKRLCGSCFATGITKEYQYQCMGCDAETKSRVFPPPGWKESDDNEVICFACAEEEAKP